MGFKKKVSVFSIRGNQCFSWLFSKIKSGKEKRQIVIICLFTVFLFFKNRNPARNKFDSFCETQGFILLKKKPSSIYYVEYTHHTQQK